MGQFGRRGERGMSKLRKPSSNFTMVPNALLRDKSISLKAKGIYALLYSKPDGWTYIEANLIEESNDGRESFRSGVKELSEAGWLTKEQVVDAKGRFSHNDLRLHDFKRLPDDVAPDDRKPVVGETAPTNTEEARLIEQDLVPPSGSPQPTKASTRAARSRTLEAYLSEHPLSRTQFTSWAEDERGWDLAFANAEFDKFCNHHIGRGTKWVDWMRAWYNWTANSRRTSQPRASSAAERNTRGALEDLAIFASVVGGGDTGDFGGSFGANQSTHGGGERSPDDGQLVDVTGRDAEHG